MEGAWGTDSITAAAANHFFSPRCKTPDSHKRTQGGASAVVDNCANIEPAEFV
jgi:hypothetical protein